MFHYDVVLPLALDFALTYRSKVQLHRGSRVIVYVKRVQYTAIVWKKQDDIDENIKYLNVSEIIDSHQLIPDSILDLAEWMHKYYAVPLGQIIFAMLPRALDVNIQVEARKKEITNDLSEYPEADRILELLDNEIWKPVREIKEKCKISGFYALLEKLETADAIELKRTYDKRIKKIIRNFVVKLHVSEIPKLTEKQADLYEHLSGYSNDIPLADIAKKYSYAIVKALKQKKLIDIEPREILPVDDLFPSDRNKRNIIPNDEQQFAIDKINSAIDKKSFHPFLLYGITGSGKTEVYIQAIKTCLAQDRSALMLVPEISLTPQMVERFYDAFGEDIAILHSRLNDRQRWQQWQNIRSNQSRIVIGARSAVFAPLSNIGIIIVDEEHEKSYKQENTPRYHGRDLAVLRASFEKAVVVLGSATPSLESWHNANQNKYELLTLKQRPAGFKLPDVEIVDMTKQNDQSGLFSSKLINLIDDRLKKKQQVILFQNRRGYSSFVQCTQCGALFKCPNCDISYNYHSHSEKLVCHYCGLSKPVPRKCPDCGGFIFSYGSPGTQQIEEQLKTLFPSARILRMDSDSTSKSDSYTSMFERMKNGTVDILLGTQMISKGLDFPNVTLVGVISADVGLNFPDFRASESTFQLLTQVAGRSGRGDIHGNVIIQTYNPSHYAVTTATRQDYNAFADIELANRNELNYAPYYKIARFLFISENEQKLIRFLAQNNGLFQKLSSAYDDGSLYLIGPSPAPIPRINKKNRYHIFIKAKNTAIIHKATDFLKINMNIPADIQFSIDIDPVNML